MLCSIQKAIEVLQDLGQNFTARIKTLEGECAKVDAQSSLNNTLIKLQEQVFMFSFCNTHYIMIFGHSLLNQILL